MKHASDRKTTTISKLRIQGLKGKQINPYSVQNFISTLPQRGSWDDGVSSNERSHRAIYISFPVLTDSASIISFHTVLNHASTFYCSIMPLEKHSWKHIKVKLGNYHPQELVIIWDRKITALCTAIVSSSWFLELGIRTALATSFSAPMLLPKLLVRTETKFSLATSESRKSPRWFVSDYVPFSLGTTAA